MRRIDWRVVASAIALVTACGGDAGSKNGVQVDSTGIVPRGAISFLGLDSVRIGEPVAALELATGEKFALRPGEDVACRYVRPATLPAGVKVMVVNDTLVRLDVDRGHVVTDKGVGIGTADSLVRAAYGNALTIAPSKYAPAPAHDLIVRSRDDTLHRMIFESDGAAVTRYRVGMRPAVDFVEGCG